MNPEILDKLQAGIEHQQNNEFSEAEKYYKDILNHHPDHPDALHLLGVLAYQIDDYEVAEELIRHALESENVTADYHNNLGEVLRSTGRIDEAREQYQQALALDSSHENALANLHEMDHPEANNSDDPADTIEYLPKTRQHLSTYLLSLDDENNNPSQNLIDLSLLVAHKASQLNLQAVANKFPANLAKLINVWPGEHYKLLAALIDTLKPTTIIEIGTTDGASTLCMKNQLSTTGKITTYDPTPWNEYPGTGLCDTDFDQQCQQKIVDLTDPGQAEKERTQIEQADIIYIDPLNDHLMTQKLCQLFDTLSFNKMPVVVLNEIRTLPMLRVWRKLSHSKLDMTSFGHWTGTGMIEWNNPSA